MLFSCNIYYIEKLKGFKNIIKSFLGVFNAFLKTFYIYKFRSIFRYDILKGNKNYKNGRNRNN
jgi:hypothetical protein